MKQFLALLAVVSLLVLPANADALRLFLAPEGVSGNDPLGGVSPTVGNPTANPGDRLYIWAQVLGDTDPEPKYISIGYNIRTTGTASVDAAASWNYTSGLFRWSVTNAGTVSGGELENVRLATGAGPGSFGVRDINHFALDGQFDPATTATVLGWIDVSGVGDLFLEIGDIGIIRTGATWDNVYLGVGDEADGLQGDDKELGSSQRDGNVIPEPASLVLLGLAGLAIRRR